MPGIEPQMAVWKASTIPAKLVGLWQDWLPAESKLILQDAGHLAWSGAPQIHSKLVAAGVCPEKCLLGQLVSGSGELSSQGGAFCVIVHI